MKESKMVLLAFVIVCLAWSYQDLMSGDVWAVMKDAFLTGVAITLYRRKPK